MQAFGFAGYSGSGKTTLIEQVIPRLIAAGRSVSVIKHAHHHFDIDKPGKDSWRHRQAGASEVLLMAAHRWVLMHELRNEPEPDIDAQLARLSPCDIVLVEGFKDAAIPKIEVHRPSLGKPLLFPDDPYIVAIVSDEPVATHLPRLDIDQPDRVATFVLTHLNAARNNVPTLVL
ncbi:MAG: molybdopterin-guanine dinucleotide biosynthesis protein B [Lautropia sp.]|nr:molybdopterin-guanine dinucleotide biosynthesis protein B [Lautropia sp.]